MYPIPACDEPPINVSGSTFTTEFSISISIIWSLTGTISFEFGLVINSITEEVSPLISSIEEIFAVLKFRFETMIDINGALKTCCYNCA